jgi:DASH complex subunit ASK1
MHGEEPETYDQADDSLLDNVDISGSTPRVPQPISAANGNPKFADYPSPYEALKQELKGEAGGQDDGDETQIPPATPGAQSRLPDMSMTPTSSPFDPTSYLTSTALQPKPGENQLLHRVLDKNYRLQATPHTNQKQNKTPANKPSWRDTTSPMSSPPVAAPQLHADIFSSPIRQQYNRPRAPRTPGISVQTPAKAKAKAKDKESVRKTAEKDEITWESDSDEDAEGVYREMGMSPPKTIQFSLPQSRLLQTPGKYNIS